MRPNLTYSYGTLKAKLYYDYYACTEIFAVYVNFAFVVVHVRTSTNVHDLHVFVHA